MKNYHIGCGYKIGKNWFNYDVSPIAFIDKFDLLNKFLKLNSKRFPKEIIFGDITKKKLCEENDADNIYLSHVLEHLSRDKAIIALQNIYLMLKPGGCFRVIVPSLSERIREYQKNNDGDRFMKSLGCVNEHEDKSFWHKLRFLIGNSRHKWMYDEKSLLRLLQMTGFKNIQQCTYNDSKIEVFSEVEEQGRFFEDNCYLAVAMQCSK